MTNQRGRRHAHDHAVHAIGTGTQLTAQPGSTEDQPIVEAGTQLLEVFGLEQHLDLGSRHRVGIVRQPSVNGRFEVVGQVHTPSLTRMTTDVLARIRTACAQVTEQATDVHIDHAQLADYARTLLRDDGQVAEDPGRQRLGDDESAAAFVIALDAINFGSGYFPYLRKRVGMSGYHTVASALRDRVTEHGPISARWLRTVDVSTCNEIFDQPDTEFAQELMALFARALRDLGDFIAGFDDSFVTFIRSADHSAAHLVDQLDRMPYFHDVATYRGLQVPIYKRAQITAY